MSNWLLPEHIADILPAEARRIEELRHRLLTLFQRYGYQLVQPPLLEYLESLLAGAGPDTELRTFKLIDQLSGRTLGLRADMTPQVARIDAHLLNRDSITRLCYCGSVLHTRPSGLDTTRELLQIGGEIYGHAGLEADVEIIELGSTALKSAGLNTTRVDLGHAGIVRALIDADPHAQSRAAQLYACLRAKDVPQLTRLTQGIDPPIRNALIALPDLYGGIETLERARAMLPALPNVTSGLDDLAQLIELSGTTDATVDLADLRGYQYETGPVFAFYLPGLANAIARGGRYDHIGEVFGRARPATGFSMDLREVTRMLPGARKKPSIRAPWGRESQLCATIAELREAGETVIQALPGHDGGYDEFDCDRQLIKAHDGRWIVEATVCADQPHSGPQAHS